jgi:tetratricopeptide (TPR) repeat protein
MFCLASLLACSHQRGAAPPKEASSAKEDASRNRSTPPATPAAQLPDFDTLWDYADPAASEAAFRELLPSADASGDASYRLQLLTQIARAQGLQRQFEAAHETLDEVEMGLQPQMSRARVRYLLERGRVFNSSRQPEKARPMFSEAWELARETGEDGYAVDGAHMMAIVETPQEALRWNEEALALAEASEDERARGWLGSLYNNIGWTYHDLGEFQRALELFEKALAWRQEQGRAREIRIARWCVARALRSLGRIEEALAMQESLLREYEESGSQSGYVFEELAECHLALERPERAAGYFALAYAELSKDPWLAENQPERIERLKRLGQVGDDAALQ